MRFVAVLSPEVRHARALNRPCSSQDCNQEGEPRYSIGIYAGRWCDEHWATAGYRKEGREGFNPASAGESYEED